MLGGVAVDDAAAADFLCFVDEGLEEVGDEGAASAAARRNSANGFSSASGGSGVADRLL